MRMGEYRDVKHLYVSVRYVGKPTTVYADETWQTGWRLAASAQSPLNTDSGRVLLNTIEVQDAYVSRTIADFDVEQGFSGITGSGSVITDADQDGIVNYLDVWAQAIKTYTSSNYTVESYRLYPIGPDGKSRTAPSIYRPTSTVANPTNNAMLPADCSIAISTQTATRGVKGRGRQFMGAPSTSTVDGAGLILEAVRLDLVQATQALMENWRAMSGGVGDYAFSPIVWHRRGDKLLVEDGNHGSVVRAVRVDNHMDTQRRRDRQVQHTWTTANLL